MARRRRRRTPEPAEETSGQPRTSIARVDYPDQDTLRLRTFWSPAPTWVYGAVPGVICALLAVVLIGGDTSVVRLLLLGGAVGYFGGGIVWAILGAMGGDVLHIEFDLKDDRARVHQSMLWVYERDWDFELDTVEAAQHLRPTLAADLAELHQHVHRTCSSSKAARASRSAASRPTVRHSPSPSR